MCTTLLYKCKDKTCNHTWMEIDTPCGPGKGFSNCSTFSHNHKKMVYPPRPRDGKKEDCPWHGLKGAYDFNRIRMVEKIKTKFWPPAIFGMPPRDRDDGTLKILVCRVM